MDSEGFRTSANAAAEPLQPHPPLGELTLHLNGRLWALAASGTNNSSIIFSPFFLIGNLLHRNTKRPGWVSADELMATPPTAVGPRAPEQSLWDGEAGA